MKPLDQILIARADETARRYTKTRFVADAKPVEIRSLCSAPGCTKPTRQKYCTRHWRLAAKERE